MLTADEKEVKEDFENVYKIISDFKQSKYKELTGYVNFADFEIRLNSLVISLLESSVATCSIGDKAAAFYIFELGLQNSILTEKLRVDIQNISSSSGVKSRSR